MTCTALPELPHAFTIGDNLPEIFGVLDGVNLSGYQIKLRINRPSGNDLVADATITEPTEGKFKFGPFGSDDFEEGLAQISKIEVIDTSGFLTTFPRFLINVFARQDWHTRGVGAVVTSYTPSGSSVTSLTLTVDSSTLEIGVPIPTSIPILISGSGNPNGTVTGLHGQSFHDVTTDLFYKCISIPSGTEWVLT